LNNNIAVNIIIMNEDQKLFWFENKCDKILTKKGNGPKVLHQKMIAVYGNAAPSLFQIKLWSEHFHWGRDSTVCPRIGFTRGIFFCCDDCDGDDGGDGMFVMFVMFVVFVMVVMFVMVVVFVMFVMKKLETQINF
jgi:hypothetical protein